MFLESVGALQLSAQEPGPFGWPHEPHGPAATDVASGFDPAVAKTDSFFARSVEWQLGQSATVLARTRVSNSCPHLLHAYSKIGMAGSSCVAHYKLGPLGCAKTAMEGASGEMIDNSCLRETHSSGRSDVIEPFAIE